MTEQQLRHHQDQMDAARAEFDKIWRKVIEGRPSRDVSHAALQIAWEIFKAAKGLRPR